MQIRLWGIRGSLPAPVTPDRARSRLEEVLSQFERLKNSDVPINARAYLDTLPPHLIGGYGGNTSCAEVTSGPSRLIIDAGSGLRNLSDLIMRTEPTVEEFHLYFTHFHWDHLIGLPFFVPMYVKGKTVHIYAVHDDLEETLMALFKRPNFPVPFSAVRPQVRLHRVAPRTTFKVGNLEVTPYQLDHPDPCWGARVEADGKSLAWAVDNECIRTSREDLGEDVKLYQNADLLVFDAQYSFGEALEKINWGHSSAPVGLDLAIREDVKLALFAHHDPAATDDMVYQAEEQSRQYFDELTRTRRKIGLPEPKLLWRFAREGEIIHL